MLLFKVGTNEAVHHVRNWLDLKHRVAHDRRCFTLMHPAVPNLPLVVLHVALTSSISASVDNLIRRRGPDSNVTKDEINTAVFYSITSTQDGLRVRFYLKFYSYKSNIIDKLQYFVFILINIFFKLNYPSFKLNCLILNICGGRGLFLVYLLFEPKYVKQSHFINFGKIYGWYL